MCVPDDSKLVDPGDVVVSGQIEPGVIMYAVPVTEVGRRLLGVGQKPNVHAITRGEGSGSGSGDTGSQMKELVVPVVTGEARVGASVILVVEAEVQVGVPMFLVVEAGA